VFVYKLIAANTVEERILELQLRKGNLAAATIEGTGLFGALGTTDIDYLFGQVEEWHDGMGMTLWGSGEKPDIFSNWELTSPGVEAASGRFYGTGAPMRRTEYSGFIKERRVGSRLVCSA